MIASSKIQELKLLLKRFKFAIFKAKYCYADDTMIGHVRASSGLPVLNNDTIDTTKRETFVKWYQLKRAHNTAYSIFTYMSASVLCLLIFLWYATKDKL